MRILITGGAGFIGSNLTHVLLGAGHEVAVVDDLSTGKPENLHPAAHFRRMDILDPALGGVFEEFSPDAVVHLAAQASVSASLLDPERDWAVNAVGTETVARLAAAAGSSRVLSASSAAVYGEPEMVPLPETAALRPANPYGESKLEAERRLAAVLGPTSTDFASLRFSNVYGPRQDAAGEGGVVAIFCDRIAKGLEPVVYGTGLQTRDFIFVGDVVSAIVRALEAEGPLGPAGPDSAAYNISTGEQTSVLELLAGLRAVSSTMGTSRREPAREGDVEHSALDPAKARRTFGFSAQVPLQRGLEITWHWFAANADDRAQTVG